MSNVLNLALKKDVFEGLQNGSSNEIHIENSKWWKKRLMDLDTGRFKDFTTAIVSSGSSDKIEYEIEKIELIDNDFVIRVKVNCDMGEQPCVDEGDSELEEVVEPIQYSDGAVLPIDKQETVEPVVIEPVVIEPEVIEPVTIETKVTYVQPITTVTQEITVDEPEPETVETPKEEEKKSDVKEIVWNLFNKFCELKDVYVVNMPSVTIRNNGQIFGCKKRLVADRDSDVKFNFNKEVFVKYDNESDSIFALKVLSYLNNLLKGNYVFVNKNACTFRKNELGNYVFVVSAVGKRKYLFVK